MEKAEDGRAVFATWLGQLPGLDVISRGVARQSVQRLLGFWLEWHAVGGLRKLVESGIQTQSSAYRQRAEFKQVFGVDVDEFEFGGLRNWIEGERHDGRWG